METDGAANFVFYGLIVELKKNDVNNDCVMEEISHAMAAAIDMFAGKL